MFLEGVSKAFGSAIGSQRHLTIAECSYNIVFWPYRTFHSIE